MTTQQQPLQPFKVPTNDGKEIFEHFGNASTQAGDFSLAHMKAPAGWSEPAQRPTFDEYVVVLRGKLCLEIDDTKLTVSEGQSAIAPKETRVRFTNPFDAECEYMALCMPAFRPDRVRREG